MSCIKSQPWEVSSLVTWFDMLQFSAFAFFYCGSALREIRGDCRLGAADCSGNELIFALAKRLDDTGRNKALSHLRRIEPEFRNIGLAITADTVKEIADELENVGHNHNFQWLDEQIDGVERLVAKEMRQKTFFYIPPERMKFWPKQSEPFAFGSSVAASFPSTSFDANSAAFCLAATLSTASVFHLMRVLEIGLSALGKVFSVSLAHTNWAPAIEEIERKIRDIPKDGAWRSKADYKEQQEFYAQAASHFAILKDAWRNYTMHVRGKYTEEEAERMFENVKAFMQKLSEKLSE